ncbi:A/G-specific adenine glycosylase, partial [bacterium]|nr:A/G-specific adenine glycosylase [bacterium]
MQKWVSELLAWFNSEQRDMPWRDDVQPYKTLVSEVMLQQTQVVTVIPYFNRFIDAFPTIQELANADLQQVLKLWEGLGYYSRARNLQKAAKFVCEDLQGVFPSTYKALMELPGVGPYIAAAIISIAFDTPVPVVDGNVLRVFTRYWGIDDDIRDAKVRKTLFDRLTPYIESSRDPSSFNQGIMELGALICSPKSPDCSVCPIREECYANAHS